jgi:uncharacterized phage protein (TIGR01671 family)
MRTLKFRIWNDGEMVMGVGLDPDCIPYKIPDGVDGSENFEYYPEAIIMQFTGLTDRSGTEIYEGDIVKNYHQLYVIKWYGMEARLMPFTTTPVDEGNHLATSGVPIRDWNWIQCVDTTDPDWRNKPNKFGTGINFHGDTRKAEACEVIGHRLYKKLAST